MFFRPEPSDAVFKQLPLEIIVKIVRNLELNDIISLKSVSKIWRSVYVNQNEVWSSICDDLNIRLIDYSKCVNDRSRHDSECKGYIEATSERLFGPLCDNWSTFNRYIMIIKNIKNNDFPTMYIPRLPVEQSYCTDDYIVNINSTNDPPIEITVLNGANKPIITRNVEIFDEFKELINLRKYPVKIIGNKSFLVLEICSIIFVYTIEKTEFSKKFFKVIQKAADYDVNKNYFDENFLKNHEDTKIDLYDHKLAMIHPKISTVLITDLNTENIFKELKFSTTECIVNSIKCCDYRLMIGITKKVNFA